MSTTKLFTSFPMFSVEMYMICYLFEMVNEKVSNIEVLLVIVYYFSKNNIKVSEF